ncbi:MAG TPA: hypothetical protein VGE43_19435 [Acidimicrobiales bacterium]
MSTDQKGRAIDWEAFADWVFCENPAKGIPRLFLACIVVCAVPAAIIMMIVWLFDVAWPLGVVVLSAIGFPVLRWVVTD